MENNHMLKNEPIGKLLLKLSFPAILAQLINLLYNLVDRIFIGRIPDAGALALTGVGVALPIIVIINAFGALVSMGASPRASIMMGEDKMDEAENILGNAFTSIALVSIILTGVILIFNKELLMLFGASENTLPYAQEYIKIFSLGTFFVLTAVGLNTFITAQGHSSKAMQTILIGAILNIILDPIFIFKFNMGVKGAALATIISQGVSAIWVLHFLTSEKSQLRLQKKYLKPNFKIINANILLGLSPFIMQFTEGILIVVFNSSTLRYGGDLAVGSMTILNSVMQFSLLPLIGLTQGSQPIISYNYGAKDMGRVKKVFKYLLAVSLVYTSALWALIMVKPDLFARIFTTDPTLILSTSKYLRIFMSMSFLFSIQIACQQTFIALGNAKTSIFLALLRKVLLLIPLIYILPLFLENQLQAVFLAEPISDTIAVLITATVSFISFTKIFNEEVH